jgi:phosphatidylglycerophosphatase A
MNFLIKLFATWGGSGYAPVASGTFGTLAAIPLYLCLCQLSLPLYLLTVTAFTILACWISGQAEIIFGEKDSGKIVIDEVAGYLVTMTAIPFAWRYVWAGFLLFRLFDIVKPPPARWFDRQLKNGYGVVLDDIAAGIYAWFCLKLLTRVL